jgi:nucleoid-associated protein YgaU
MPQMAWQSNLEASSVAGAGGPYSAGGGRVVAQPGDTLRSLSQRAYGSSSYWYVLAEANGYSSADDTPAAGISLSAPALTVTRNDAGTFKPYNPLDALGPSTPSLPFVPPSSDGCGKVGQMLMVIVAVVVTIYTAGAASAGVGSFLSTMQAGVTALGTSMSAAAIGGAVGSIASQAVGLATGTIQNFSWRGVATSALTAGAGAGIGSLAQAGAFGSVIQGSRAGTAALTGLGSSVANASINGGFSWRQVAANVVGNAIGSSVGGAVGGALGKGATSAAGQFAADLTGKLVGGVVSMHARRKAGSSEGIDYASIGADALANTLVGRWTGQHSAGAANARRVRNGAADLLNWRPSNDANEAAQDWGILDPNGPYAPPSGIALEALSEPEGGWVTGPRTHTVRSGDTLSDILGTSDPAAIGRVMALNGLKNSTIRPGQTLTLDGELPYTAESVQALGQAALNRDNARVSAANARREAVAGTVSVAAGAPDNGFRFFEHSGALSSLNVGSPQPATMSMPIAWRGVEGVASNTNHAVSVADKALEYVAKYDAQKVLGRAWALQEGRMVAVARAGDMSSAIGVFKNPNGQAATALAGSAAKYGGALKGVAGVGYVVTAVEEGAYLARVNNENPDKLGYAVGATVTNVAGETSAIYLGAAGGAKLGAFFAPWTVGMSIPVGAALGGIGGHFFYDGLVKPQVREGWTGIEEKK